MPDLSPSCVADEQRGLFEIVAASVTGFDHESRGEPCQDCFAIDTDCGWTVAVVSDGAGSAPRALDGARIVTSEICQALTQELRSLKSDAEMLGDFSWARDAVAKAIERARERCLAAAREGEQLRAFHATVVGGVMLQRGGVLFHIGDGGASAHRRCSAGIETICFSEPENGEYSNQTYFYTEQDWKSHLRIAEVNELPESIWLMTDGAYELMVPRQGKQIREVTESEITRLVFQESESLRTDVLRGILSSPQAASRNDDDKTLVILRKRA